MNNCFVYKTLARLENPACSFAYVGENGEITSDKKGIRRLLELADTGADLSRGFVADRVIGKAAALLMVLLGAKRAYGETVSRAALDAFEMHGVAVSYRYLVPYIINRAGDGMCPMERTVWETDSPEEAYELLHEKMKQMKIS